MGIQYPINTDISEDGMDLQPSSPQPDTLELILVEQVVAPSSDHRRV